MLFAAGCFPDTIWDIYMSMSASFHSNERNLWLNTSFIDEQKMSPILETLSGTQECQFDISDMNSTINGP